MIIRKMQATFGKLEGAVLTPQPGLNIICLPNEAGKTTWGAFLTAMLYGVDTKERTTKDGLAVKDRYRPWCGKPMEGTVELIHEGRNITIQRQSKGKIPMGVFRAWDTDTGEEIPAITADNCGRVLTGVEKSVFLRSAFIGQGAMAVTRDAGLEQRLSSLVTAGDETVSHAKTADTLRQWKNHVRHNRTGLLPETEALLRDAEDKLQAIRACHREDLSLHTETEALTARQQRLSRLEAGLLAAETRKKRQQLTRAEEDCRLAEQALAAAREKAAGLPTQPELLQLRRRLEELRRTETGKGLPHAPEAPVLPQGLQGQTPAQLRESATRDAARLLQLEQAPSLLPLHLFAGLLAAVALGLALWNPLCLLGLLPAGALGAVYLLKKKQRAALLAENGRTAERILALWETDSADGVLLAAARHAEALERHARAAADYEAACREQEAERQARQAEEASLLTALRGFAVNIYTLADGENAVTAAENAHREAENAETLFVNRESTLRAVRAAVGELPETEDACGEDFATDLTLPQVQQELARIRQELSRKAAALATHRGQVQALGDPAALEAQKQQLAERQAALQTRYDALTLAAEVLAEANDRMRSQFSPRLTQVTAELFSAMTGGKYTDLRLPEDLAMEVREEGEAVTREQSYLSGGTRDQLYLALRLAVCRLALGEDVPLVLDDALVYFDEDRLAKAMALLEEEAKTRQILLFTCRA